MKNRGLAKWVRDNVDFSAVPFREAKRLYERARGEGFPDVEVTHIYNSIRYQLRRQGKLAGPKKAMAKVEEVLAAGGVLEAIRDTLATLGSQIEALELEQTQMREKLERIRKEAGE